MEEFQKGNAKLSLSVPVTSSINAMSPHPYLKLAGIPQPVVRRGIPAAKNAFDETQYLGIIRAFAKTALDRGCYVRSH